MLKRNPSIEPKNLKKALKLTCITPKGQKRVDSSPPAKRVNRHAHVSPQRISTDMRNRYVNTSERRSQTPSNYVKKVDPAKREQFRNSLR